MCYTLEHKPTKPLKRSRAFEWPHRLKAESFIWYKPFNQANNNEMIVITVVVFACHLILNLTHTDILVHFTSCVYDTTIQIFTCVRYAFSIYEEISIAVYRYLHHLIYSVVIFALVFILAAAGMLRYERNKRHWRHDYGQCVRLMLSTNCSSQSYYLHILVCKNIDIAPGRLVSERSIFIIIYIEIQRSFYRYCRETPTPRGVTPSGAKGEIQLKSICYPNVTQQQQRNSGLTTFTYTQIRHGVNNWHTKLILPFFLLSDIHVYRW